MLDAAAPLSAVVPADIPVAEQGRQRYRIQFEPAAAFFVNGNDPLRIIKVLDGMGELTVRCDELDWPPQTASTRSSAISPGRWSWIQSRTWKRWRKSLRG